MRQMTYNKRHFSFNENVEKSFNTKLYRNSLLRVTKRIEIADKYLSIRYIDRKKADRVELRPDVSIETTREML